MKITKLDHAIEAAKGGEKKRIVVAYGQDAHSIEAVSRAVDLGIVEATLVADEQKIKSVCEKLKIDVAKFRIVDVPEEIPAGQKTVALIRAGEGEIIMKGVISSDNYLRAILNKQSGLLPPKGVLSHIGVVEADAYHKLILFSDGAVIPEPDFAQKVKIANYLVSFAQDLGIKEPKLAVIAHTEKADPKREVCNQAALLSKMADRGQIKGCIIDGPLALDVAIDKESAEIKGVKSVVAGDADCLLFPEIVSANVFYKTVTKLAKAQLAGVVVGTMVPSVLASRGDSTKTKLQSIALASLMR